jgi:hypothetical protein
MIFPHLPEVMYSHKYQPDLPLSRKIEEIVAPFDFWLACLSVDMILGTDLSKAPKNEDEDLRRWLG